MTDAFIYDHVRTPRGRGKPDGALHEVTALRLACEPLRALKERNGLDPALVDDVVLGCVDAVGEAAADIARQAALVAGYGDEVPGVQINRFCASGLDAVNFAAAEIMSGQHDMTIGGGAESMSRIGWAPRAGPGRSIPQSRMPTYFVPQGISADLIATRYGFSRDDVDAYAVESQKRAATAWREGRFSELRDGDQGHQRPDAARPRRAYAAGHHDADAGAAPALVRADRRDGRLRCGGHAALSRGRGHRRMFTRRAIRPASWTVPPPC